MTTIQLSLSEQEADAVKYAICVRLSQIRGYGLNEEKILQSMCDKLTKKLNKK